MQVPLVGTSLLTRLKSHNNSFAVWSKTGLMTKGWAKIHFVAQLNPTKELQDWKKVHAVKPRGCEF